MSSAREPQISPTPASAIFSNITVTMIAIPKNSKIFNHLSQGFNEPPVLLHRADGHADMLGKLIAVHGTHDHALDHQLLEYLLTIADAHQDKIALARHMLQAELFNSALEKFKPLPVRL